MNSETMWALVRHIAEEWRALRADDVAHRRDYSARRVASLPRELWNPREDERWPWGAWMAQHAPLDDVATEVRAPVHRAWFVDDDGLREMSPWSFLRFWPMQIERRWTDSYGIAMPDAAFAGPRWRIGYASFAEYEHSGERYLETTWGELWARGRRVQVADGVVRVMRDL